MLRWRDGARLSVNSHTCSVRPWVPPILSHIWCGAGSASGSEEVNRLVLPKLAGRPAAAVTQLDDPRTGKDRWGCNGM